MRCFNTLARILGMQTHLAFGLEMCQTCDELISKHADMLVVHRLPEWPVAATALVRFVVAVSGPRGLKHTDNVVRQCCVDLLGTLVSQLYFEASEAERERKWLSHVSGESHASRGGHGCDRVTGTCLSPALFISWIEDQGLG